MRQDGYCRSEAIVAIVIEATSTPMGYCRLAGVSINSDGSKSEGITYPSRHSQAANALEAFYNSGLSPRDIGYVEAHGTGTVAGDREELAGLHQVFYGSSRTSTPSSSRRNSSMLSRIPTELDVTDPQEEAARPRLPSDSNSNESTPPLSPRAIPIGSVKSNLGHTEGASGLVSMVKVLMMYEQRTLLPNLHYKETAHTELAGGFFAVPTSPAPWEPAPACVSNYGFGGSNAFFILDPGQTAMGPPVIPSADVTTDVAARLVGLRRPLTFSNSPTAPPIDSEWAARQIASNNHLLYTHRNGEPCTPRQKVCYVFGGQGAQWAGMGKALLASSDIFRKTVERCDAHLTEHGATEISLLDLFDDGSQWFDPRYSSLGITAYQVRTIAALSALFPLTHAHVPPPLTPSRPLLGVCAWTQLGVVNILADVGLAPDFYIGHSLGETAAAYAAAAHGEPVGSERSCILCAYARGRVAFLNKGGKYMVLDDSKPDGVAYEDEPGEGRYALKGKMAAVGLPAATIQAAIDKLSLTQTVVACYNQPAGQTVSGAAVEVDALHEYLLAEVPKLFFRALDTNEVAYHAKHTRLFEKFLRAEFAAVVPACKMDSRWITTNVDVATGGSYATFDAEYLVNNVCNPVHFQSAVEALPPNTLVVEVGSSSSLLGLIKRTRTDIGTLGFVVNKKPETERILADPATLTKAIWQAGHTFTAPVAADVKKPPPTKKLTLNGRLPLERRYPDLWDHETKHRTLSFGDFAIAPSEGGGGNAVKYDLGGADKCLLDHVVDGRPLFPAMGHVLTIWRALDPQLEKPLLILDLEVTKPVGLSPDSELEFRVLVHESKVTVLLSDEVVAKARLGAPAATNAKLPPVTPLGADEPVLHAGQIYGAFKRYGYEYADAFQLVDKRSVPGVAHGAAELAGSATETDKGGASTAHLIAYLDCALQLFLERLGVLRLPTLLRQVHVLPSVVHAAASVSTFNMAPATRDVWSDSLRLVELHTLPASARRPVGLNCAIQRFVPLGVTVLDGAVTETPVMDQVRAICARRLIAMLDAPPAKFDEVVPPKMADGLRKMATPYLEVPLTTDEAALKATSAYAEIALDISARYPEVIGNVYTHITVHEKHMDMYTSKPMSLGQYTLSLVGLALAEADDPTIIEIGAGTGGLTRRILDAYSNEISAYTASDCDPIYWTLPKVTTEVYDLNNPPPPNASKAALAVASNAVHTAADMQKSIRHMAARVHPGGHILLEESISDHVCFTWGLDAFAWETAKDTRSYCLWLSWAQYEAVIDSIEEVELVAAYKTQTVAAILLRVKEPPSIVEAAKACPLVTTWQQVSEGACAAEELAKEVVFAGPGARGLQLCLKEEDKEASRRVRTLTTETDEQAAAAAAGATKWPSTLRHGAIAAGGKYGSLVRVPFDGTASDGAHVSTVVFRMLSIGDLSSGAWIESPMPTSAPVTVAYSGLNFKDLMIATNKLRVEVPALGLEFSGVDADGKRLMGMTSTGSLAKSIEMPPLVWPVPEGMGLDEAATVPVVYCTVLYALVERARLTAGDSILIHAVSGGIGRAALQVARSMGLEVYATCAPHKREHVLASCGIAPERLGSSRDGSFKNTILTATGGAGVDCVLNSLADELLLAGVEVVAEYGHFCEIGKVDFQQNSSLGLAALERNVSFHAIDLAAMFSQPKKQTLLRRLLSDALAAGWVVPLDMTTFDCNNVEQALRFMAASKHLGKVLISMADDIAPSSVQHRYVTSGEHLIVGGLGGLGLEMSEWLLANGAATVVLAGRSGVTNGWQAHRIGAMRAMYGESAIATVSLDCTDAAACDAFVSAHSVHLTGVWHCAMNLRDVLFANMTEKQWSECVKVKAAGLANLDASTRKHCPKLQTFMACSSIVAMTGNAGQSNYAYANAAMEAIVRARIHDGLHGLAVNWGLLDNVGFITTADKEVGAGWLAPQNIDDTLEKLHAMTLSGGVISCIQTRDTSEAAGDVFDEANLRLKLSGILGGDPTKYDANRTLEQLGIDSLGLVELRNWVRRHCRTASVTTDVTLTQLIALTAA